MKKNTPWWDRVLDYTLTNLRTTTIQLLSFSKDVCKILRVYLHSTRNSFLIIKYSINMRSIYISSEIQLKYLLMILSVSELQCFVSIDLKLYVCIFFVRKLDLDFYVTYIISLSMIHGMISTHTLVI